MASSPENRISGSRSDSSSDSPDMERGILNDDEEFENDLEVARGNNRSERRRTVYRHSHHQHKQLERVFSINHHPNKKDTLELATKLSLEFRQVKFWFQNRRTQLKAQRKRQENNRLKRNNETVERENQAIREVIRTSICKNCNGKSCEDLEHQLRVENQRIKGELKLILSLARSSPIIGRQKTIINSAPIDKNNIQNIVVPMPTNIPVARNLNEHQGTDHQKLPFGELAQKAMCELEKLVKVNEPLWNPQTASQRGGIVEETLNLMEYAKAFPPCLKPRLDGAYSTHCATRASATIAANSSSILHAMMDEKQWVDLFPSIVGKTGIEEIMEATNSNFNGSLMMMYAELQPLSPLVPVRRVKFLRFGKHLAEGVVGIVDVSIEPSSHEVSEMSAVLNCTRFPSGCIVQDLPNGCSKVMWVEHLEYEEKGIHPLVFRSSSSFGAQRWLASLQRQCQCLAVITSPDHHVSNHDDPSAGTVSQLGKRTMINMAHRMMRSFSFGICSTVHKWKLVHAGETRVHVRRNMDNSGTPRGLVLSATHSVWMPVSHRHLFNFLNNKHSRGEWEDLNYAKPLEELVRIDKGNAHDEPNRVSLLRRTVISSETMNQHEELILQETQSDSSGSMMVFAPLDIEAMQVVLGGQDSSSLKILPAGFSIVPNIKENEFEEESCIMTVAFQIIRIYDLKNMNVWKESIETVNTVMLRKIQKIKSAFLGR